MAAQKTFSTLNLLELAQALSIAATARIQSPEQASFVWKTALRDGGFLPPKDKDIPVEEK